MSYQLEHIQKYFQYWWAEVVKFSLKKKNYFFISNYLLIWILNFRTNFKAELFMIICNNTEISIQFIFHFHLIILWFQVVCLYDLVFCALYVRDRFIWFRVLCISLNLHRRKQWLWTCSQTESRKMPLTNLIINSVITIFI